MIENSLLNMSDREFDRAQGCFKPSCMDCDERYECDGYMEETVDNSALISKIKAAQTILKELYEEGIYAVNPGYVQIRVEDFNRITGGKVEKWGQNGRSVEKTTVIDGVRFLCLDDSDEAWEAFVMAKRGTKEEVKS